MAAKAIRKATVKLSSAFISRRFDEIADHFKTYSEIIQPLIIHIEELGGRFPVEILNEIRAAHTHLSRIFLATAE